MERCCCRSSTSASRKVSRSTYGPPPAKWVRSPWPGAVRTGHPIYSFAAIGKRADEFRGVRNFSGYGEDSPFGVLHHADGRMAVLDLPDNDSMTFYHYVEESCSAPYRYHKRFAGL